MTACCCWSSQQLWLNLTDMHLHVRRLPKDGHEKKMERLHTVGNCIYALAGCLLLFLPPFIRQKPARQTLLCRWLHLLSSLQTLHRHVQHAALLT